VANRQTSRPHRRPLGDSTVCTAARSEGQTEGSKVRRVHDCPARVVSSTLVTSYSITSTVDCRPATAVTDLEYAAYGVQVYVAASPNAYTVSDSITA